MEKKSNQKGFIFESSNGFTLIEILVVIGIIAILAAVVLIAINPARQFAQARNSQRISNINAILNAIGQRMADNKGIFDGAVNATQTCPRIDTAAGGITVDTDYAIWSGAGGSGNWLNLSCLVTTYIPSFPKDPKAPTTNETGYVLRADAGGRITVKAPLAELGETIQVTR